MTGAVKSTESAAILAFPAPVRKARGALLPLLEREPSGAMANMADAGSFAV